MKVSSFFIFASKYGCKSNTTSSNFSPISSDYFKNLLKPQYRQFHASSSVQRRQDREERGVINRDLIGNVDVNQGNSTSVGGVNIPFEYFHYMTDPYGRKGKRDKIQEKKAKRLKNVHDRSREPKLISSLHDSMKTKPLFSRRQLQIGKQLKRVLLDIMSNEFMEKPTNVVLKQAGFSIIDIEMSKDIKHSNILWKCEISDLKEKVLAVVDNLSTANWLRWLTAQKLPHLKFSPEHRFIDVEALDSDTQDALEIMETFSKRIKTTEGDNTNEEKLDKKALAQKSERRSKIMTEIVSEIDQKRTPKQISLYEEIPKQKGVKTKGYNRFFKRIQEPEIDPKYEISKKNKKKLRS